MKEVNIDIEAKQIETILNQIQSSYLNKRPYKTNQWHIYKLIKAIAQLYEQFTQCCELLYTFRKEIKRNPGMSIEQIIDLLKSFDFYGKFEKINKWIKADPGLRKYHLTTNNENVNSIPATLNPPQIFLLCENEGISRQISQHLHLLADFDVNKSFFTNFKGMCINEEKKRNFSTNRYQSNYCYKKYQKHCNYGATMMSYKQYDLEDFISFCTRNRMCPYFTALNQLSDSQLVVIDNITEIDYRVYKYMQSQKDIIKIEIITSNSVSGQIKEEQQQLQEYITDIPTLIKLEQQEDYGKLLQIKTYVNNLTSMELADQMKLMYKQTLFRHLSNLSLLKVYKEAKSKESVKKLYQTLVQYDKEVDIIALMVYFKAIELNQDDPIQLIK